MQTEVQTLLRRINATPTRFRVLCTPIHEAYSWTISHTPHEFYLMNGPGLKQWSFQTRDLPPNHYMYMVPPEQIRNDINVDILLTQNRMTDYPLMKAIKDQTGLPLINLTHTSVPPGLNQKQIDNLKGLRGDINVYITDHNKNAWGDENGIVIPHGIDDKVFKGYTGETLGGIQVCNFLMQREVFCGGSIFKEVASAVPLTLIGENPGLSQSINKVETLAATLAKHRFYLNTSIKSPLPMSVLESCSVGLPLVSTAYEQIPLTFVHGESALLSNNVNELKEYCKLLIKDKDLADKIGRAGQKVVRERFGMEAFIKNWNAAFQAAYYRKPLNGG